MPNPNFTYDEETGKHYRYKGTLTNNGELAGTCSVRVTPIQEGPDNNYLWVTIDDLFVAPKFQGNGCERFLIEKILKHAENNQLGLLKNHRSNHPTKFSSKLIDLLFEMGFHKHDDKYLYHTFDGGDLN